MIKREFPHAAPDDVGARLSRFGQLGEARTRLAACESPETLFAVGADLARERCAVDRGLIARVSGRCLTAVASSSLADAESDRMRRQLAAGPVAIDRAAPEGIVVRHGLTAAGSDGPAPLAELLGLRCYLIAPITLGGSVLAVLILDRDHVPPDAIDVALASAYADAIAVSLERHLLRIRVAQVESELRHLTVSAQALMTEVANAPLTIPAGRGDLAPSPTLLGVVPVRGAATTTLLTEREIAIASQLADGRSNREIAAHLFLAPATVKGHVARILRKLDAANRAEAAAKYLELRHADAI